MSICICILNISYWKTSLVQDSKEYEKRGPYVNNIYNISPLNRSNTVDHVIQYEF